MTDVLTFLRVTFTVETETAVTQGARAVKDAVDLPLARDLHQGVTIPATTMAGSLRRHALDSGWSLASVSSVFGRVADELGGRRSDDVSEAPPATAASDLWLLDCRVTSADAPVERTTTAIDRSTAAARKGTMRKDEFLPAGARVDLDLRLDSAENLDRLSALLSTWRPSVGRGTANGRGRLGLQSWAHGSLDLDRDDDLVTYLTTDGPALVDRVATEQGEVEVHDEPPADVAFVMEVAEAYKGPGHTTRAGDHEEFALDRTGDVVVLQAEQQRGVLRSQIEHVIGSLGAQQLMCAGACDDCWSCRIFGHPGRSGETGRRSAIGFAPVALSRIANDRRQRNSIDRFTGGTLPGALWTEEVLIAGRAEIGITRMTVRDDDWLVFVALLRLVLDDVDLGLVRWGSSVTTGHGRMKVSSVEGLPSTHESHAVMRRIRGEGAA